MTAPPEVINLANTSTDTRYITLQWQRPATNCNITGYCISYDGAAMWGDNSPDVGSNYTTVTEDTYRFTYNLTGLVPYSNYSVQVWAETSAGEGVQDYLNMLLTDEDGEYFRFNFFRKHYSYFIAQNYSLLINLNFINFLSSKLQSIGLNLES